MIPAGFQRFAALDRAAVREFTHAMAARTTHSGSRIALTTLEHYLHLLIFMHEHRHEIQDSIQIVPFPGERAGAVARAHTRSRAAWPYTPDTVAVPLIQGAIDLLSTSAIDILRARECYHTGTLKTLRKIQSQRSVRKDFDGARVKRIAAHGKCFPTRPNRQTRCLGGSLLCRASGDCRAPRAP
jgi:hypothetical protein